MKCSVVSQVIKYGPQHWQLNADGSWSTLMFGSFGPNQIGLKYQWVPVDIDKVPQEVKEII